MPEAVTKVFQYHQSTKHRFNGYARGPGFLDWVNQPDPFRRYPGSKLIHLRKIPPSQEPLYDDAFGSARITASPPNIQNISQLFFDSLSLSAWKSIQKSSWALRVNPSSGNLHPTECYLICSALEGICDEPMVAHYAPKEHGLEIRTNFSAELWSEVTAGLPSGTFFLALTSIHWREAWKYGERAFRYCQHDVGHALGAIRFAAAGLGWRARLLDDLSSDEIAALTGTFGQDGAEAEEADCLIALTPSDEDLDLSKFKTEAVSKFRLLHWHGQPNQLSHSHVDWNLKGIAEATNKPETAAQYELFDDPSRPGFSPSSSRKVSLRQIIRQRRSAVSMDGVTSIPRKAFYLMLSRALHRSGQPPFDVLPWKPHIHLAIFVHRVDGLAPGLYFLVRDLAKLSSLQEAVTQADEWVKPDSCPEELGLFRLFETDTRNASKQISCTQDIASDGCFSLGMIAEYEDPIERYGPWFYRRLFWESGLIGQILYLEAEAAGIRSTGIGCYFDDAMHDVLGLKDRKYQDLYHFTVGGPLDDKRLTTLPAYQD